MRLQRFQRFSVSACECSQVHSVANKYGLCPTRLDMASLCGVCMKKILRELKEAVKANKVLSFLSGEHEKRE